jgi:hypothetical protein
MWLPDLPGKKLAAGGLTLSRYSVSATLIVFIVGFIVLFPKSAGSNAH